MKGDFSRLTFDPLKQFTSVFIQQGRVQLDADWNEQAAILLHYLKRLAADLIGPYGGPAEDCGFAIVFDSAKADFTISKGRYYVDGLLCENPAMDAHYYGQPSLPLDPKTHLLPPFPFLVYLDVWERHISSIEDGSIREVALEGPDTATRAQVVWQVRMTHELPPGVASAAGGVLPDGTTTSPTTAAEKSPGGAPDSAAPLVEKAIPFPATRKEVEKLWLAWVETWQPAHRGSLRAQAKPSGDPLDPCVASPAARYRGVQNQLYRVEVHAAGMAGKGATFKWSRDNASTAFAIVNLVKESGSKMTTVTLADLGHESRPGLDPGDWVEIVDDGVTLEAQAWPLLQVATVDGERRRV
ncbi:MAG TPA: DUF6519 domain-containing protein, partial [Thermoanaerobaculia bacterium]|nr:DUF6519 domain-containing protein [Thermoanaerobaculia bacterium]